MNEDKINNIIEILRYVFKDYFIYTERKTESAEFNNIKLDYQYILTLLNFKILEAFTWTDGDVQSVLERDPDRLKESIIKYSKNFKLEKLTQPIIHLYREESIRKILDE